MIINGSRIHMKITGKAFQAEVFFQKLFGKRRGVQKVGFMPISRV